MRLRNWIISAAFVATLSLSVYGQRVAVSYDPSINFSSYRKYLLLESKNPSTLKICHQTILDTIQVSLALRGLLPVNDGEKPDLYVVYNAGIKEVISIQGYDYNYGSGTLRSVANDSGLVAVTGQPDTLVIDLVDAKENRLVWRGIATGVLIQEYGKAEKKVATATRKMFSRYPAR